MRKCFWDLDEGSNIQLRIADNIPSNRRALTCNYSDAPVFTLHSATFCPKLQHNLLITEDLPLCCSSTCSSGRGRAMGEYESERERERVIQQQDDKDVPIVIWYERISHGVQCYTKAFLLVWRSTRTHIAKRHRIPPRSHDWSSLLQRAENVQS